MPIVNNEIKETISTNYSQNGITNNNNNANANANANSK